MILVTQLDIHRISRLPWQTRNKCQKLIGRYPYSWRLQRSSQRLGSKSNCKRGEALSDFIYAMGLLICNDGNKSTFNKGTFIDITIASPRVGAKITNWQVLDEISLSDHYYISFEISNNVMRPAVPKTRRKIDLGKLDATIDQ